MPRRVSFGGKVQEFPDNATDDEIGAALEAGSKPPALSEPKSVGGFGRNVASSAGKFAQGIGSAVMHPIDTAMNMGDVAYGGVLKGMKAVGIPGELSPEEQQQVGKFDGLVDTYKNRYGSMEKIGDTLYTDPVGVAADVSMVAGGAGAALKGAGFAKAAQKANAVSQATNPLVSLPRAASRIPGVRTGIDQAAKRMYQGGLKPPPGTFSSEEVGAMVDKGLNDGIPVSGSGLEKTRGKIDTINKTVAKTIGEGAEQGKAVDPVRVASKTERSMEAFRTVDPADQAPITGVRDRFVDKNSTKAPYTKVAPGVDEPGYVEIGKGETSVPKQIPVDEAQRLKQNTYRDIRESYGEQASGVREAKKDLARGLKEQIYEHFPELQQLGQEEKVLIDLENALERYSNRHGNRDMVSLGGPAKIGTLAAVGGGVGATAGAIGALLEIPAVKSRLAIAIRAAQRNQRRAARGRQVTNAASRINEAVQPQ